MYIYIHIYIHIYIYVNIYIDVLQYVVFSLWAIRFLLETHPKETRPKSVLQYVAVCCSVLQYVAVCCSVLCFLLRRDSKRNRLKKEGHA